MEKLLNEKKYFFFWGGIFSNWFPSDFKVDDVEYNCGEQYMMHMKAKTFGDEETAKLIMSAHSPRVQKALGRKVKNFDSKKWDEVKYELVKRGLREKFNQNSVFNKFLLHRKDCIIVEASPEDRIWGIGYDEHEAEHHMDNWGENLLGKILTELANE